MEAPQPQKKNWFLRHKVWSVIIVLLILGIIGASSSGNKTPDSSNGGSSPSATPTSNASASSTTPTIGQPAYDGKFQFTVTSFKCGVTQVVNPSDTDITDQPQGQFCLMGLTIKNIGTEAQNFDDSSQYLYDASSKQYSYASGATSDFNGLSSQFDGLPTVNPGVSISGTVVFDIPTTTAITYAMLHDSSFSNGVKVNLQ